MHAALGAAVAAWVLVCLLPAYLLVVVMTGKSQTKDDLTTGERWLVFVLALLAPLVILMLFAL